MRGVVSDRKLTRRWVKFQSERTALNESSAGMAGFTPWSWSSVMLDFHLASSGAAIGSDLMQSYATDNSASMSLMSAQALLTNPQIGKGNQNLRSEHIAKSGNDRDIVDFANRKQPLWIAHSERLPVWPIKNSVSTLMEISSGPHTKPTATSRAYSIAGDD
jgi:hypothetical protein